MTIVSMRDRRWLRIRRTAMLWMLRETGATYAALASPAGIGASRVAELVQIYERVIKRRQVEAKDWIEPWAKRLRAVGAIP